MTITHDLATRAQLAKLKAQVKALESPVKAIQAKARREAKRERVAALARTEGQRQPRVREPGYLAFLRKLRCLRCGASPCDAAHVRMADCEAGWRYVGKGEKPDDARAVPLCRRCHELQHSMSEARFWADHLSGLHAPTVCGALHAAYLVGADGAIAVRTFAGTIDA